MYTGKTDSRISQRRGSLPCLSYPHDNKKRTKPKNRWKGVTYRRNAYEVNGWGILNGKMRPVWIGAYSNLDDAMTAKDLQFMKENVIPLICIIQAFVCIFRDFIHLTRMNVTDLVYQFLMRL